jgi:hypothetical protein
VDQLIIQYTTASGIFVAQHVAMVEVALSTESSTCMFAVGELAGDGRILP